MAWAQKRQIFPSFFNFGGLSTGIVSCDKKTCVHYKEGYCSLANPEKVNGDCLDFEDAMDFLRLKADPIRGTLS